MWTKNDWFEWIEIVKRQEENLRRETLLLKKQERIKKLKKLNGKQ